mmetsp:Transcript_51450/g.164531  ORF Transcript_51450/g.164531 Transcript_51450/m.164531 type:complete len:229 (-) Transcript_51450:373-1059(-)
MAGSRAWRACSSRSRPSSCTRSGPSSSATSRRRPGGRLSPRPSWMPRSRSWCSRWWRAGTANGSTAARQVPGSSSGSPRSRRRAGRRRRGSCTPWRPSTSARTTTTMWRCSGRARSGGRATGSITRGSACSPWCATRGRRSSSWRTSCGRTIPSRRGTSGCSTGCTIRARCCTWRRCRRSSDSGRTRRPPASWTPWRPASRTTPTMAVQPRRTRASTGGGTGSRGCRS